MDALSKSYQSALDEWAKALISYNGIKDFFEDDDKWGLIEDLIDKREVLTEELEGVITGLAQDFFKYNDINDGIRKYSFRDAFVYPEQNITKMPAARIYYNPVTRVSEIYNSAESIMNSRQVKNLAECLMPLYGKLKQFPLSSARIDMDFKYVNLRFPLDTFNLYVNDRIARLYKIARQ